MFFHQLKKMNNFRGFSLVQVLMATAIMGIVSLGIVTLIDNGTRSQRGLQAKSEQLEILQDIRLLLANKLACTNTLSGYNPATPYTVSAIKDKANYVRYAVNTKDPSGLLNFDEFKVEDWEVDPTDSTKGRAKLKVKVSKVGHVLGAKELQQKLLVIQVKRNSAGILVECYAISGGVGDSIWQRSADNPNDIFYSEGNVGIGVTNAHSTFQVEGSVADHLSLKNSDYTVTSEDHIVAVNAAGGMVRIALPSAVGIGGRTYTIKKTDISANIVRISPNGAEKIDGVNQVDIASQNLFSTVISDGSNWLVIGGYSPAAGGSGERGSVSFTAPGSYSFAPPIGVTRVSVVCVGGGGGGGSGGGFGGGGGGGGGLAYRNNISVTPGTAYPITVGAAGTNGNAGGDSFFSTLVQAGGGRGGGGNLNSSGGGAGGTMINGEGGGNGGAGGSVYTTTGSGEETSVNGGGGGGAGGYVGNGGAGSGGTPDKGFSGAGGGGGGGGTGPGHASAGGGVGIFGQGSSGVGGVSQVRGEPGSAHGGNFGAGGSGGSNGSSGGGDSSSGACRVVWGAGVAFPSTNVSP